MAAVAMPAPASVLGQRRSRTSITQVPDPPTTRRPSGATPRSSLVSGERRGRASVTSAVSRNSSRLNTPDNLYFPYSSWDALGQQLDEQGSLWRDQRNETNFGGFGFPQASFLQPMMETQPMTADAGPPEGGRRPSYGTTRRFSNASLPDDEVLQVMHRARLRTDSGFGFPIAPTAVPPPAMTMPGLAPPHGGMPPAMGVPHAAASGLASALHPGLVPGLAPPAPAMWPGGYPYDLAAHLAAHQQPAFLQPPTPYVHLQHGAHPPDSRVLWGQLAAADPSDLYGNQYSVPTNSAATANAAGDFHDGPKTTLMLQNLPDGFTRDELINLLNSEGFAGKYDFAYLPVAFDTMKGLNHAFINLCTPADAEAFQEHFSNFNNWPVPSGKVCVAAWHDRQQGLAPLIERYKNSPVMHESVPQECKPLIFQNGRPVAFPPPTMKIKPPKAMKKSD